MLVTATSSKDPVASLRYRAMNGTEAPSAKRLAVAATCLGSRAAGIGMMAGVTLVVWPGRRSARSAYLVSFHEIRHGKLRHAVGCR